MARDSAVSAMNSVVALERAETTEQPPAQLATLAHPGSIRLGLPSPQELKVLEELGKVYAASGLLPAHIKTWQAVVVAIRFGYQLGLDEWTALNNIYFIKNAPALSAGLMHALIVRDHGGHAIVPVSVTPEGATARYKRREWAEHLEHSFTFEQARKAGLVVPNSNWEKWPDSMCWARLIGSVARLGFIDSIKGLYVPEEFGYRVEPGGTLIDAEGRVVEPRPPLAPAAAPAPTPTGNGNGGPADPAMRTLHWEANQRGITHDDLHAAAVKHFGVGSMKDLTAKQKQELVRDVQAIPIPDATTTLAPADELLLLSPQERTWLGNIRKARDVKTLDRILEMLTNQQLVDCAPLMEALEARRSALEPETVDADAEDDGTAEEDGRTGAAPARSGPLDGLLTWPPFWAWLETTAIDTPPKDKQALELLLGETLSPAPQKAKEQVERWIAKQR